MRHCWFCVFETPSLITSLDVLTACICSLSPDEVFIFPIESAGLSLDSMRPSPVSPVSCNTILPKELSNPQQSRRLTGHEAHELRFNMTIKLWQWIQQQHKQKQQYKKQSPSQQQQQVATSTTIPVQSCFGGLTLYRANVYFHSSCAYNQTTITTNGTYKKWPDQIWDGNKQQQQPQQEPPVHPWHQWDSFHTFEHVQFHDCLTRQYKQEEQQEQQEEVQQQQEKEEQQQQQQHGLSTVSQNKEQPQPSRGSSSHRHPRRLLRIGLQPDLYTRWGPFSSTTTTTTTTMKRKRTRKKIM